MCIRDRSPAYDITYSYNPSGAWTSSHQMTLNGKRENFDRDDIATFASAADLTRVEGLRILDQILDVVTQWPTFAEAAGVEHAMQSNVSANLRLAELAIA